MQYLAKTGQLLRTLQYIRLRIEINTSQFFKPASQASRLDFFLKLALLCLENDKS